MNNKTNKRRSNTILLNIISAVVIIGAIVWGLSVFFHWGQKVFTDDAQVEAYINPINTRIPGYIKEVRFTEHESVKKGDTLLLIDDREFKIQEEQAASLLADAMASKGVAASVSDIAGNNVYVADANVEELKARLANMETNYRRYENLLKEDVVTQYQFDQVHTELEAMRAKYHALQVQQAGSQLSTHETKQKIMVADANIRKAQASLDMAKLNLSYTVITAPYDGVVGRKIVEEGQLLQAGQPMVSIVRGDAKWVTANYTEAQIAQLHIGQEVSVTVDAVSHKVYTGKVVAISEATGSRYSAIPVDNSTGNFVKVQQRIPVKIAFTEANTPADLDLLRAGMNVEVKNR